MANQREWQRVSFANHTDEDGNCALCGEEYINCPCPGPSQDELYEYRVARDGVLQARLKPAAERG